MSFFLKSATEVNTPHRPFHISCYSPLVPLALHGTQHPVTLLLHAHPRPDLGDLRIELGAVDRQLGRREMSLRSREQDAFTAVNASTVADLSEPFLHPGAPRSVYFGARHRF